jgi:serine/threonine protein kinase
MNMEMTYSSFASRYRDKQYIGSGGFAKVYKVFDYANNHYVALKIADVRPEWKQFTLQREVELVNRLDHHQNIARYDACYRFNTGYAGEMDFAVLKFYEHGNLEQFLVQQQDLSPNDIRIIIQGILEGIGFLHRNNLIHRDMKCQNILINREDGVWMPKITDFGLSRQLGGDSSTTNSAVGLSFAYAAPEQIANQKIHKNVDLWAVGVILYRIIAGELPFQSTKGIDNRSSQSQLELSQKILNLELPQKLEELQEPYQAMIKRCLVIDPQQRVQSAEELIEMLNAHDASLPTIPAPSIPEPFPDEPTEPVPPKPGPDQPATEQNKPLPQDNDNVPDRPKKYPDPNGNNPEVPPPPTPREPLPPTSPEFEPGEGRRKGKWALWLGIALLLLALIAGAYALWQQRTPPPPKTEVESAPKFYESGDPVLQNEADESEPEEQ